MVAVADRIDGWRNDPLRRLIHRESFRASVLHHSGSPAVPQSIAAKKCLLTTPSLLSMGSLVSVSFDFLPRWYPFSFEIAKAQFPRIELATRPKSLSHRWPNYVSSE